MILASRLRGHYKNRVRASNFGLYYQSGLAVWLVRLSIKEWQCQLSKSRHNTTTQTL